MRNMPKAHLYCDIIESVEQRIVDALPDIIDGLIDRARLGDVKVAPYLCDRILGRAAVMAYAPGNDNSKPYTEDDFLFTLQEHEDGKARFRLNRGSGANGGV
jgi:hypothetical protein